MDVYQFTQKNYMRKQRTEKGFFFVYFYLVCSCSLTDNLWNFVIASLVQNYSFWGRTFAALQNLSCFFSHVRKQFDVYIFDFTDKI